MQAGQGVCLFCRRLPRSRPAILLGRRKSSSPARKKGVFNASKLVLDLEAASSKYVRRFEDSFNDDTKAAQENCERDDLPPSSADVKSSRNSTFKAPLKRISLSQATPPDYFSYALLGNPFTPENPSRNNLRRVFLRHGTSPKSESFEKDILWFLINAQLIPAPTTEQMLPRLNSTKSLTQTQRMISLIANSRGGPEFLASNGKAIHKQLRVDKSIKPIRILKAINSTIQMLESEGLDPGPDTLEAGLYYAAMAGILCPVKKYIDMIAKKQYPAGKYRAMGIREFARNLAEGKVGQTLNGSVGLLDWSYGRTGEWQRRDTLKLMTGWQNDGAPGEGEIRGNSFATIIANDRQAYRAYVAGLATLRAKDALWYEFNHPLVSTHNNEERASLFANAFRRAGGFEFAIKACRSTADGSSRDLGAEDSRQVAEAQKEPSSTSSVKHSDDLANQKRILGNLLEQDSDFNDESWS